MKTYQDLEAENAALKRRLAMQTPENRNGVLYFAGSALPYCPRCYERDGRKLVMQDSRGRLECGACGCVRLP
jgi:ferredoxin-like protein FixX